MDNEQIALKLQETTDRSLRNEEDIKELKAEHGVLHSLASSVAVMTEQMKTMNTNVSDLKDEVEELKEKPGKRWDALIDKIFWGIAGALLAYFLSQIGL